MCVLRLRGGNLGWILITGQGWWDRGCTRCTCTSSFFGERTRNSSQTFPSSLSYCAPPIFSTLHRPYRPDIFDHQFCRGSALWTMMQKQSRNKVPPKLLGNRQGNIVFKLIIQVHSHETAVWPVYEGKWVLFKVYNEM